VYTQKNLECQQKDETTSPLKVIITWKSPPPVALCFIDNRHPVAICFLSAEADNMSIKGRD